MQELATKRGQRAELRLADGTRVILGVNSRLRFPALFNGTSRTVYLEGEALFDVVHNASKPFFVNTATAVTEDLGTTFVVRAYPGEPEPRVMVSSGRVALRAAHEQRAKARAIDPGQVGMLGPSGKIVVSNVTESDMYLAWTEGRLVFRDTPLRDVVRELSRWYDIDIHLADDTIGARLLTSRFGDEPLPVVLDRVARTLGLRVEQHDRVVTFRAKL
jgi:transmembrane sensor